MQTEQVWSTASQQTMHNKEPSAEAQGSKTAQITRAVNDHSSSAVMQAAQPKQGP